MEVINNVVEKMCGVLDKNQLDLLKQTLEYELLTKEKKDKLSNERLLDDFILSKSYENCSQQTIEQYRRENTKFLKSIRKKVENVNKKDIEKYLSDYRQKHNVSDVTLNNMRRFISAFFNYLEFEDIIKCNPVRKTKPVREVKLIKPSFTDLEVEEMRENVTTLRDKAIIETLNTTGVRVSELCNMNVGDITNGSAVIRGKGNKERTVYFSDKALYYLQKYLGTRKDTNNALFVNLKKTSGEYVRVSKSSVEKMIRDVGRKMNVKAHPHKFRRTVATRGINKGMPIQEIRVLLGHSKIDTTLIYCNVAESNVQMSHKKYIS